MSRAVRLSALSASAVIGVLFVLWPSDAFAWGPLAHLNFSSSALSSLDGVSMALRALLGRYGSEFLYGSLAADIIVGKNLAKYAVHCHNWRVGFSVLDRAKTDAQRAFSYGFLAHLAVDTVAHNYYVPYKTVQGFRVRATGHAYWELRYDQRLPSDLWKVARHVTHSEYREHDEHLQECLSESYVIPFSVSKKMFGSLLLAARLKKWQRMSELVAGERDLSLQDEEVGECRRLAVEQILGMLRDGDNARCTQADPTGERNLHLANQLRLSLGRRNDLAPKEADEIVRRSRPAFKSAIHGRLALPELPAVA
jgi:hypothetical protein